MPDVYFQSNTHGCELYREAAGAALQAVSVVISPIKVSGGLHPRKDVTNQELKVTWGCNLWRSCHNPACFLSLKARTDTPKIVPKVQ